MELEHWKQELFDCALLRGNFTLRSGAKSDRYFDKYRLSCNPRHLALVGKRLSNLRRSIAPDTSRIIAPELGAVPLATALSLHSNVPFAIVRSLAKTYGTSNRIEGPVVAGESALLVEDVITSGSAALEAAQAAREAGLTISHAVCVLDRDSGGRESLANAGIKLHSLLSRSDLDTAFDAGIGVRIANS